LTTAPSPVAAEVTVTVALALTIDLATYNEAGMIAQLTRQFSATSAGTVQVIIDDFEGACRRRSRKPAGC
jgi:hypothetical protein